MTKALAHTSEPQIELTEEAWREIECAINLKEPSQELREYVADNFRFCYSSSFDIFALPYLLPDNVRPRDMRAALSKIAQLASNLADLFDLEDSRASSNNPKEWASILSLKIISGIDKKTLVTTLRAIDAQAKEAMGKLRADRGGAPRDTRFIFFVNYLGRVYTDLTGNPPRVSYSPSKRPRYRGPFFKFVETILRHLLPEERHKSSNSALGKAIQRVLRFSHSRKPMKVLDRSGAKVVGPRHRRGRAATELL
jgi:hypothetical protein